MLKDEIIKFFKAKGRSFDEMDILAWHEVLENYPIQKVIAALNDLKEKKGSFIETGTVVEFIKGKQTSPSIGAWYEVLMSARNGGRNPIHARAATALNYCGGMRCLMDATDDDLTWIKKEFEKAYENIGDGDYADRCMGLSAPILPEPKNEGLVRV